MKKIFILLISLIPFLCVLAFANPVEGLFTRNLGSLSSTFIFGLLAFIVLNKYGKKNGLGASMAWGAILAIGLGIASLF
jgi:hypothetical protein